jgi:hypothetical protein
LPSVRYWTAQQKSTLLQVIHAKTEPDEMRYLHLTQSHGPLRAALLSLAMGNRSNRHFAAP